MDMDTKASDLALLFVIVNAGMATRVVCTAKRQGMGGGTIFLGTGTVKNSILEFLELADVRKEMILMGGTRRTVYAAMDKICTEYKLHKPHHGIAFVMAVQAIVGSKCSDTQTIQQEKEAGQVMYQLITIVVDKGRAEDVIDAATKAGSKGGTIVNARGSGIHETSKLFSMEIEPEKEIVLILSEWQQTSAIVQNIREELQIEEPGNGIIFVQTVENAFGIA